MKQNERIFYLLTARGEEYIADDNCSHIEEHRARGDGDKWYYDIHKPALEEYIYRVFDPVEVRLDLEE